MPPNLLLTNQPKLTLTVTLTLTATVTVIFFPLPGQANWTAIWSQRWCPE